MSPTAKFFIKRVLFLPVAMLVIISLAVVVVAVLPGDPARVIGGPLANAEQIAQINADLGLKDPLPQRYLAYMTGLAKGDLGTSYYSRQPVVMEILRRLPATLELVVMAMVVALLLGVTMGGLGAYFRSRLPDRLTKGIVTLAQSIPDFFLGLLLIYVFFFLLGWAPSPTGRLGFVDTPPPTVTHFLLVDSVIAREWSTLGSALGHMVLPVVTLGFVYSAYFAKTARNAIGKALRSPQVEFARAMGLPERQVLRYALVEARTPILTYGGILTAALIGGAAIVEIVFTWNGLGQWALDAILRLDVPAIQGFVIAAGFFTLLVFTLLDILVAFLDPRVSYG